MTRNEMNRRLNELTEYQRARVRNLIREGYGAQGIKHETNLSIRLINAVFQQLDTPQPPMLDVDDFNCVSSRHHY